MKHTLNDNKRKKECSGADGGVSVGQLVEGRDVVNLSDEVPSVDKHSQASTDDHLLLPDMHCTWVISGPYLNIFLG